MATTLSLVVIFLPVAFMEGQVGRFFPSFGVTVAVRDHGVAVRLVHADADALRRASCSRRPGAPRRKAGGVYRAIDRAYGALLALVAAPPLGDRAALARRDR